MVFVIRRVLYELQSLACVFFLFSFFGLQFFCVRAAAVELLSKYIAKKNPKKNRMCSCFYASVPVH